MSRIIACPCGQQLDVSDFAPGQQVQCPQCQKILTVAAQPAEPPMAVAVALPDEDDEPLVRPTMGGATPLGQANALTARRRSAEKRAAAHASSTMQRVLVWPALFFALVAFGIGFLGIYLRTIPPKLEKVREGIVTRIYANVPKIDEEGRYVKDGGEIVYERVEVQPDIYPGDEYVGGQNPILLNGQPLDWGKTFGKHENQTIFGIIIKDKMVPVVRRGLWFYRFDQGKPVEQLDLPLIGAIYQGDYEPVIFDDEEFYRRMPGGKRGPKMDVAWYIVSPDGVQERQMKITQFHEQLFWGMKPKMVASVFALSGFAVGLVLLALGGLMLYNTFFSAAAKQLAAQKAALRQEQGKKQPVASQKS